MGLLVEDDGDCVVEEGLSKDDGVELWVDLVRVEDRDDRHRVRRRQRGSEDETFEERKFEALESGERPQVDEHSSRTRATRRGSSEHRERVERGQQGGDGRV